MFTKHFLKAVKIITTLIFIAAITTLTACSDGVGHTSNKLVFNTAFDRFPGTGLRVPDNYLQIGVPDEKINQIFYGLNLDLGAASVIYNKDGSLWNLRAHELTYVQTAERGPVASTGVTIELGAFAHETFFVYAETPVISDLHGIAVTAYSLDFFR